ncbi:Nuclear transcription factor Y subunit B-5 [Tripterygium wilfordii]|uniref:Nuclear transcription factor Y subunit B-5 n=1 Tax=Tripterygium wilfordii TaxID=458696 RepID=A0A7J7CSJ3_TRIWF|nr:nuclear transcription factor Y subunit B-1-like [Tripterygium wilfordii]KAF5736968.1 Nuclear transcription factor Y subunit B-5 [Tripterygium wilfordii]
MVDKAGSGAGGSSEDIGGFKEQERLLPIANVGRIMKQILPVNGKISKEAKETMQECVSEFVSFVTSEASEKCKKERRKTINGDDVCWAMGALGFDDYAVPLRRYLYKYRESEGEKINNQDNQNEEKDQEEPTSSHRSLSNRDSELAPNPLMFENRDADDFLEKK